MRDIGAVAPAEKKLPADPRRQPARDRATTAGRPQPRKPRSDDEMVETESHTLDLEV
jgi:hypothetical protein